MHRLKNFFSNLRELHSLLGSKIDQSIYTRSQKTLTDKNKNNENNFQFDFAISYASEEHGIAHDLYKLLLKKGAKVFLAEQEKVYLWGKRLKHELRNIFGTDTKFSVILLSKHYVEKFYPNYELNVAKTAAPNRDYEFILPICIDNVNIKGLEEDVFYIDMRSEGILNTIEMMMEKLKDIYSVEKVTIPTIWTVTYGLNIKDLFENYQLPPYVPRTDPFLCNWLEKDLMEYLSKLHLESLILLEDARTGETLSIRVGFKWNPEESSLDLGDIGWWEVLQVAPIEEIYTDSSITL
jgi:hypothetical protein